MIGIFRYYLKDDHASWIHADDTDNNDGTEYNDDNNTHDNDNDLHLHLCRRRAATQRYL